MRSSDTASSSPVRVGVIGFGPVGMMFSHHVEERRRKLIEEGRNEELAQLPVVQCFEKGSGPGGNWAPDRVASESLWMTGPKEAMEFFDYTFLDHYGQGKEVPLPAYIPRAAAFEYMMARVTRNSPQFLERYARFNTEVKHVEYDEEKQQFTFNVINTVTGEESVEIFDKCIWGAGELSKPKMPNKVMDAFSNFVRGPVVHSTRLKDWKNNVVGKHILLVGGNFSAEDIALAAIKRGVEKVTVLVRNLHFFRPAAWTKAWPEGKVDVILDYQPVFTERATQTIVCAPWDTTTKKPDLRGEEKRIEGVDTVVLCTGYDTDFSMVGDSVWAGGPSDWELMEDDFEVDFPHNGWKMKENVMTSFVGDIPAPEKIRVNEDYFRVGVLFYGECILMTNPNFMAVFSEGTECIMSIDVSVYLCLSAILGETILPTKEQVVKQNIQMAIDSMNNVPARFEMDSEYRHAMLKTFDRTKMLFPNESRLHGLSHDLGSRQLAMIARDGHYPVDFGSWDGLTKCGQSLSNRTSDRNNGKAGVPTRATYRDLSEEQCNQIRSLHTGVSPKPFSSLWLDLDDFATPLEMV